MNNKHGEFDCGIGKGGMAVAIALLLAGCASPQIVQSVQPQDAQMGCAQLIKEVDEAEKLRVAAEGSKGSSGGNLVKGLLFFPALLVSNDNVKNATEAAEARKTHLAALMSQKNCKAPAKPPAKPGAK